MGGMLWPRVRAARSRPLCLARRDAIRLQATGRKKLLIAGIVTDVCVLFPTLSALAGEWRTPM